MSWSSERAPATSSGGDALPSRRRRNCGAHTTSATAAGTAQIASPGRQPPPKASATGTDTPAASAAKPISVVLYIPVRRPTRSGKFPRTSTGSSTFPTAIAVPAIAVPTNRNAMPGRSRTNKPASSRASAPPIAGRAPNLRASTGASGASAPKQNTGSATRMSAPAFDRPVSDWIRSISGPMPAAAGRRFAATTTIPIASRTDDRGQEARGGSIETSCRGSPISPPASHSDPRR